LPNKISKIVLRGERAGGSIILCGAKIYPQAALEAEPVEIGWCKGSFNRQIILDESERIVQVRARVRQGFSPQLWDVRFLIAKYD
jgi:hypothetical protein